jgi:hypothetical protein
MLWAAGTHLVRRPTVPSVLDTRFPSKKFKGGWHFGSSDGSVQKHRGKLKFQVLSKVIHRLKHTAAKYSFFNKPGGKAGDVGGADVLEMEEEAAEEVSDDENNNEQ